MEWYDAMATSDELDLLSPPIPGGTAKDAGQQRIAVYELHRLVKARLAAAWSDNGGEVPRKLLKAKAFRFGEPEKNWQVKEARRHGHRPESGPRRFPGVP